jgi:hypothetical protein
MAFGKPVIIVGEKGFSVPLTPETAESIYYKGMYGQGDGSPSNVRLEADIRGLVEHPDQLQVLGEFSRQVVLRHFSLEEVSAHLAKICGGAAAEMPPLYVTAVDGLRTAAVYLRERRFLTPSRDPWPDRSVKL